MTPQELGTKLKQARENVGMKQADVANTLNLNRTAITQMEKGNRSVSTLELSQLAALYHRPVSAFFGAPDAEEDMLVVLYCALPDSGKKGAVKKQVSRYLHWCQEGHNLERILGRNPRSGPPAYDRPMPDGAWEAIQQGEHTADEERKRLDLGNRPVSDMSKLIQTQGIWASGVDFSSDVSGLFLSHSSIGMAIFANLAHSRNRKRFSYAHEYAHALMDRDAQVTVSQAANSSARVEMRANAFAAAFLMPADGIAALLEEFGKGKSSRNEHIIFDAATAEQIVIRSRSKSHEQSITYYDVAMIAHHFGVRYEAATYRLKSLRHISDTECDELLEKADAGKEYLRRLEYLSDSEGADDKNAIQRELRGEIIHLALEAHRREEISRGKLGDIAKLLGVDKDWLMTQAIDAHGGSL